MGNWCLCNALLTNSMKFLLNFFIKKRMKDMVNNNLEVSDSQIKEPIFNHLTMKTTGALLLTGDWGSGKTYHIKNKIFPLVEKETEFTPIIVSLYGEADRNIIAQKVLFSYFDSKGKNVNLGTGTIANNVKNLANAVPIIKKFVDIEKLILGAGENIFKLIPHDKLLICFDDIERMSDKINIDDFLGLINDLTENKGCKVLLIANKAKIEDGIKEKTIEKTIHFTPNLSEIFDNIVSDYPDSPFKSYLTNNKDLFVKTLTPNSEDAELNKELKIAFSNIRTLKFALEHFKVAFEILIGNAEITPLQKTQLKNIWIFTLSISIEFRKPNTITLEEKKELDNQTSTFSDFGFQDFKSFLHESKEETVKEDKWAYSEDFKKKYYNRLSEQYIYHEELYVLITSSKKINENQFKQNVEDSFKVTEGKINPAHQILSSFLQNGIWEYSNEDFAIALNRLLEYCEKGELEDVVSYLNAGVYLLGFNEIIAIEKDIITEKIKTGLDLFLPKVDFNAFVKTQFEMVQGEFKSEHLKLLVDHIKQKTKETEKIKAQEEIDDVQDLFQTDLSAFVKEFLPANLNIRSPDKPLFHNIETEVVKNGIKNAQSKGIVELSSLLKIRYLDVSFSEYLTDEIKFLNDLESGIAEIDFEQKTLSNHFLLNDLKPRITEAKQKLQGHIDHKNT